MPYEYASERQPAEWKNSFGKRVSKALIERINFAKRGIKKVARGYERKELKATICC